MQLQGDLPLPLQSCFFVCFSIRLNVDITDMNRKKMARVKIDVIELNRGLRIHSIVNLISSPAAYSYIRFSMNRKVEA